MAHQRSVLDEALLFFVFVSVVLFPAGLRGTVTHVDDTGTVFAKWENNSSLGAVYGIDRIRRVK